MKARSSARRAAFALLAALLGPGVLVAQAAPPKELSLEQALELARSNNPLLQASRNDLHDAEWGVRAAYGSLLPTASVSSTLGWQGSGEFNLGALSTSQLGVGNQPSTLTSNYNLSLSYGLSGRTLLAPGQANAQRESTAASIRNSEASLDFVVTQVYLGILRQEEGLVLATQEMERAQFNLRLAQGQLVVGTATRLDVTQAEVAVGRAEISILQSETAVHTSKLRLMQQLGLQLDASVALTSAFALEEPTWEEQALFALAVEQNPTLAALRANQRSSDYGVRIARSAYFPTISVSGGVGGFAREQTSTDLTIAQAQASADNSIRQCEALNVLFLRLADPLPTADCSAFGLTDEIRQSIIDQNDVFPFDYTSQPWQFSLSVTMPLFQGLSRQRQIEAAQVAKEDANYQRAAQELQLSADIAAGLADLRTAFQTARIEQRNQVVVNEQLRLAQEQYRIGTTSFLQLVEAETVKAQADRALVDSIFTYHENLASLESVVGTTLRTR